MRWIMVLLCAWGCNGGGGGVDGGPSDSAHSDGGGLGSDSGQPDTDGGVIELDPQACGWQAAVVASPMGSDPVGGSITLDPAGGAAFAWRDPARRLLWMRRAGGGVAEVPVLQSTGETPAIAFDATGAPHLFTVNDRRVQHASQTTNGWRTETFPGENVSRVVAASGGGRLVVIYRAIDLHAAILQDGEWTYEPLGLQGGNGLRLTVDETGTPHVSVWDGGNSAYYARRTDEGWQSERIDGVSRALATVVDARGWPHHFFADSDDYVSVSWNGREFVTTKFEPFVRRAQVRGFDQIIDNEGNRLAIVLYDDSVVVIDPQTGQPIAGLEGRFLSLLGAVWSGDSLMVGLTEPTTGAISLLALRFCDGGPAAQPYEALIAECAGGPADLANDAANCGACGRTCGADQLCIEGWCVCEDIDAAACGARCDPINASRTCEDATVASCGELTSSVEHCGACGQRCRAGETCGAGACSCAGTLCGDECLDTQNDPQNCGDCGKTCTFGCAQGDCEGRSYDLNDGNCTDLSESRWTELVVRVETEDLQVAERVRFSVNFRANYYSTHLKARIIAPNGEESESEFSTDRSGNYDMSVSLTREEFGGQVLGEWRVGVFSWTNGAGPQAEACNLKMSFL